MHSFSCFLINPPNPPYLGGTGRKALFTQDYLIRCISNMYAWGFPLILNTCRDAIYRVSTNMRCTPSHICKKTLFPVFSFLLSPSSFFLLGRYGGQVWRLQLCWGGLRRLKMDIYGSNAKSHAPDRSMRLSWDFYLSRSFNFYADCLIVSSFPLDNQDSL